MTGHSEIRVQDIVYLGIIAGNIMKLSIQFWRACGIALCTLATTSPTRSQIVPDSTLSSNSKVIPDGNTKIITGGTAAGGNLFHSFEQFSVPTGSAAYFNNALDIQNIISRVTGDSVSNIDGALRANGTANLFLLNPNGIIFGPNAELNIGGSILASTAFSLNFADGTQFSATAYPTTPLLTVGVPIGLQLGRTVGPIRVQGLGNNLSVDRTNGAFVRRETPAGLQVKPGKTLALVGSDVTLEGGNLIADGGRIEVGSVAGPGLVSLTPTNKGWTFGYEGVPFFQDIQLSERASVDASGEGGGDIQVQGRHVTLTDGSAIFALTLGPKSGGTVTVNAFDSVEVIGTSANPLFPSAVFTDTEGAGAAGNLTITTGQLLVQNGAKVTADTLGAGDAGNLTVNANTSVKLSGTAGRIASGLFTTTKGNGAAGDLTITTGQLLVQDGAVVTVDTLSAGNAGNLTVNADTSVKLSGNVGRITGLFAQVHPEATGKGGNLIIETGQLLVQNGAVVSTAALGTGDAGNLTVNADTSVKLLGESADGQMTSELSTLTIGAGDAGDLTIVTRQLIVQDGAQIAASTFGEGSGGTLEVNAKESVEVSGTSKDGQSPSRLTALTTGIGNAGDLRIETGELMVRDDAAVTVNSISPTSDAKGAGDIDITAQTIRLDDQGAIAAGTASGQGGDITLQDLDLLLLRRNSNISTTAGTASAGGDGGNIRIDTDLLAALENSDIIARAFDGQGGNIRIKTQGIFRSPDSDIDASSKLGIDGVVEINTPDIDPSRGLVNAADKPAEVEVAQGCRAGGSQAASKFVVTGRGGLPPNPREALSSDAIQVNWVTLNSGVENRSSSSVSTQPIAPKPGLIVEAQGWVIAPNGEVVLTTSAVPVQPHSSWQAPTECHATKTSS